MSARVPYLEKIMRQILCILLTAAALVALVPLLPPAGGDDFAGRIGLSRGIALAGDACRFDEELMAEVAIAFIVAQQLQAYTCDQIPQQADVELGPPQTVVHRAMIITFGNRFAGYTGVIEDYHRRVHGDRWEATYGEAMQSATDRIVEALYTDVESCLVHASELVLRLQGGWRYIQPRLEVEFARRRTAEGTCE